MQAFWMRRAVLAALAIGALFVVAGPLLAINVQPVIIDLLSSGRRTSSIVTLQNTFSETVPIEMTARPIRIVDGQLVEIEDEEAENILVFPAQATIQPGASQAFRVQWVGDPRPTASEHYYVTAAQLPVALAPDQNAIQVLHRFRVLVNVAAPDARADLTVTKVEVRQAEGGQPRPVLTATNTGDAHGYVANHRMTIVQRDGNGQEIFRQTFQPEQIQQAMGLGVVPSGQTRILPIGVDLPSADGAVSIELASPTGV